MVVVVVVVGEGMELVLHLKLVALQVQLAGARCAYLLLLLELLEELAHRVVLGDGEGHLVLLLTTLLLLLLHIGNLPEDDLERRRKATGSQVT